jgi:hypothetical protein
MIEPLMRNFLRDSYPEQGKASRDIVGAGMDASLE